MSLKFKTVFIISRCGWKIFNFSFKFKNINLFVLISLMLILPSFHHDTHFVTDWTVSLLGFMYSFIYHNGILMKGAKVFRIRQEMLLLMMKYILYEYKIPYVCFPCWYVEHEKGFKYLNHITIYAAVAVWI